MCIYRCMRIPIRIRIRIRLWIRVRIYAYTHPRIHAYTHISICAYAHVHIHIRHAVGGNTIRYDAIRYETIRYDTINLDTCGTLLLVLEYSDRVSALVSYAYVSLSPSLSICISLCLSPFPLLSAHPISAHRISSHLLSLSPLFWLNYSTCVVSGSRSAPAWLCSPMCAIA